MRRRPSLSSLPHHCPEVPSALQAVEQPPSSTCPCCTPTRQTHIAGGVSGASVSSVRRPNRPRPVCPAAETVGRSRPQPRPVRADHPDAPAPAIATTTQRASNRRRPRRDRFFPVQPQRGPPPWADPRARTSPRAQHTALDCAVFAPLRRCPRARTRVLSVVLLPARRPPFPPQPASLSPLPRVSLWLFFGVWPCPPQRRRPWTRAGPWNDITGGRGAGCGWGDVCAWAGGVRGPRRRGLGAFFFYSRQRRILQHQPTPALPRCHPRTIAPLIARTGLALHCKAHSELWSCAGATRGGRAGDPSRGGGRGGEGRGLGLDGANAAERRFARTVGLRQNLTSGSPHGNARPRDDE